MISIARNRGESQSEAQVPDAASDTFTSAPVLPEVLPSPAAALPTPSGADRLTGGAGSFGREDGGDADQIDDTTRDRAAASFPARVPVHRPADSLAGCAVASFSAVFDGDSASGRAVEICVDAGVEPGVLLLRPDSAASLFFGRSPDWNARDDAMAAAQEETADLIDRAARFGATPTAGNGGVLPAGGQPDPFPFVKTSAGLTVTPTQAPTPGLAPLERTCRAGSGYEAPPGERDRVLDSAAFRALGRADELPAHAGRPEKVVNPMDELTPAQRDRLVAVLTSSAGELRRLNAVLGAIEATLRRRQRRSSGRPPAETKEKET
jgi:hypothetical protein